MQTGVTLCFPYLAVMNEELLYFIWKHKLAGKENLTCSNHQTLQILKPGNRNTHSGPDFSEALLQIEDTLWAGQVEVHVKASDWIAHHHQHDHAYKQIILHVVWEEDVELNLHCPTLQLKNYIPPPLIDNYIELAQSLEKIPCSKLLTDADSFIVDNHLIKMSIERLEQKCKQIKENWQHLSGHWEQSFYELLASGFGFKVNALPMEITARTLPLALLGRYKDKPDLMEALFFGQAGFLSGKPEDGFQRHLKTEYEWLRKKHNLLPQQQYVWKYGGLRPANFPALKLSQFASLIANKSPLLGKVLECHSIQDFYALFYTEAHPYWAQHSKFGCPTHFIPVALGNDAIHLLLANVLIPFLFLFAEHHHNQNLKDKAFTLFCDLPSENNQLIRIWSQLGIKAKTMSESQGLIQTYQQYCQKKRCLECSIGLHLLKRTTELVNH